MKSLRGTFQSMHVRNFRLFFTGQLISQGGTWMQTIALNWLVLHLSHNNGFLVGLAIALQFLPTLLFGVWGGAIADRFDKRKVLLCTQVAMAAVAVEKWKLGQFASLDLDAIPAYQGRNDSVRTKSRR